MDTNHNGVNRDIKKDNLNGVESPKSVVDGESDGDDESLSLLHSTKGGLAKNSDKPRRKVQWLDKNGDKLAQILEFQPSDANDSDDEESDSCICRIM